METVARKVYYYETENGRSPFIEWLTTLTDQVFVDAWQKRLIRIRLGLFGKFDPVGDGVQEFKFYIGPGYRVYFAEWGNATVVLLYGGDKSTQSRKDIALARTYWNDFKRSNQ